MVEERQRDGHDPTEKLKQRKLRQRRREWSQAPPSLASSPIAWGLVITKHWAYAWLSILLLGPVSWLGVLANWAQTLWITWYP
jgi:hypothetical protein